jgi:hypothetical protein
LQVTLKRDLQVTLPFSILFDLLWQDVQGKGKVIILVLFDRIYFLPIEVSSGVFVFFIFGLYTTDKVRCVVLLMYHEKNSTQSSVQNLFTVVG